MKFLLGLFEILLLFVAAFLVASIVWKVFAMIGLVGLTVSLLQNFLFAFIVMLFMYLLREASLFSLGIIIVVSLIALSVLGYISPGDVDVSI